MNQVLYNKYRDRRFCCGYKIFGAGNEIRTRDPHVGNVMHDQLANVSDLDRY